MLELSCKSLSGLTSLIVGRAGASPPRCSASCIFIYICTYVSIRHKHSAVKPAITDSGAQHPQSYVHAVKVVI